LLPYECADMSIISATTVCHSKKINFTGYLGKMSSKTKKTNITTNLENTLQLRVGHFRLDYMSYMLMILYNEIDSPSIFVDKCLSYGFSKEDIQENISVILIADGSYSKCDYSYVDKKVKASITKLFAKPPTTTTPTTPTTPSKVPPTKSSKPTKQPKEKKGTTTSAKKIVATPPIKQIPVAVSVAEEKPSIVLPPPPTPTPQPVSVVEEKKTKPTSTIVRRRVAKNQPEPTPVTEPQPTPTTEIGISNQKEKPTSTIVRKKKTTV